MNTKKIIGIMMIVGALIIIGRTLWGAVFYSSDSGVVTASSSMTSGGVGTVEASTTSADKPLPAPAPSGLPTDPVRLMIPALKINANVQITGMNSKGDIGTPNNFTDVAWYNQSVTPGEIGNALIDGHVDNGLSLAGVFKHLDNIQVGDDVYVTDRDGSILHFQVTGVESYPYQNPPTAQILASNGTAELTLVTCTGDWVRADRTYDHRLVVTTELVK